MDEILVAIPTTLSDNPDTVEVKLAEGMDFWKHAASKVFILEDRHYIGYYEVVGSRSPDTLIIRSDPFDRYKKK